MNERDMRIATLIEILKEGLDEYILTWENDKICLIDNYVNLELLAKYILDHSREILGVD